MRSGNEPPGQARSFTERARRTQIVSAAVNTIVEVGYARASVAEIARRAGVSKSLVLYHFAGKDDLVDEVVREAYTAGTAFLSSTVDEHAPPRVWLRDYLTGCVRFLGSHRVNVIALAEVLTHSAQAGDAATRHTAETRQPLHHVADQLRRGQKSGDFRDFSVPVMARAIRSVLDDLATQHRFDPELDLESYAAELVETFDRATRSEDRNSRGSR